ncbi:ABC transporter transmembrane domain-containing protein, partial [Nocardioides hankookensis]
LATRGATAAEPYLTRYVPALVLAGVLPVVTLVAIATQDPMSALIVLLTLPLIPVFGILVGLATRDRARLQWRALESLSGHFLDVMRGLPTLVAFRRAEAQSATIRSITERYRRRTVHTLQIAFASSAVLELVATLSVALVAGTVGIRLSHGDLDLETALVVLLLAPEAY